MKQSRNHPRNHLQQVDITTLGASAALEAGMLSLGMLSAGMAQAINDGDRHGHRGYNAMLDYQQALDSHWDLFSTARWFRNIAQYQGIGFNNVTIFRDY